MPDFKSGQIVQLNDGRRATVRFAGQTSFQVGEWIGVELEDKTGKNDGSVQGQRYFDCPMGYGMFVKPMMATIIAQPPAAVRPGVKKAARPSSFINGTANRPSLANDASLNRRKSLNAPSPSPVSRTTRPASIGRLPGSAPREPEHPRTPELHRPERALVPQFLHSGRLWDLPRFLQYEPRDSLQYPL
ncbi:Dynactin, isoform [Beauveria bassiana]|nr:Dynactin, isoform [Beauveria bassiana]